ncbi:hypothetical protein ACP70R_015534 [Stipagrostis hirtigluma subsp. patula]
MGAKMATTAHSARPAAEPAAAISSVLGDDDLLGEILLRLALPTDLVRAAAVCRRWLRAASHPAFLRRFRGLHPPRLLGFYLTAWLIHDERWLVDFTPMLPQPPELAAVLRRGSFSLDSCVGSSTHLMVCRNGTVLVSLHRGGYHTHAVHSPLHPPRGLAILPALPTKKTDKQHPFHIFHEVLCRDGRDGLSYFFFSLDYIGEDQATAHVYELQDDIWRLHGTATTHVSMASHKMILEMPRILLVDDRICMALNVNCILVWDLTSSAFCTIELPDKTFSNGDIVLSRADVSGFYLVHVNELQLRIWLHIGGNGSLGDWSLVDTVSLHDMCANLRTSSATAAGGDAPDVYIHEVGDNADFAFLEMYGCVVYLDVRSRAMHKVYDLTAKGLCHCRINSFMMIWPPIFPALKE